ncbi:natural cytotoxicity triggering receptor 3 ligand 1-like isoform X2 [Hypanus sabinus]|nr:natural cytotoxicity triggering receptor 3 ligand 1-like isoform X2 [Hypanus sabinus]
MTIFRSPKNVLLYTDITLECKVTDFGSPVLDLSNVGVQWLYGSQKKEIYIFNAGTVTAKRSGAKISTTELQKGDASLYLPNIQLSEAGEYSCVVLVTPDKVEKSSRVVVLAKPKVLLSTQHITILNGTEKSVWCNATEFYPQNHEIFWEKISRGKAERLERHVYTGAVVSNNDGTFNVSSNIRIVPTLNDDGNIYKCTVRHQSLPDELSQEVKLTVEEPESTSTAAVGIPAFLGGLALYFPFAAGVLAYFWIFLKDNVDKQDGSNPAKSEGCAFEETQIIWYRDANPFDEKGFVTNKPFENASGFTTELTYTPKPNDKASHQSST